ncbi:MAG: hypothetical protein K6G07_00445 [Lachnospiraceae bacterium]|nr:hypothetical protein [Lachnospiraceae bacterium]
MDNGGLLNKKKKQSAPAPGVMDEQLQLQPAQQITDPQFMQQPVDVNLQQEPTEKESEKQADPFLSPLLSFYGNSVKLGTDAAAQDFSAGLSVVEQENLKKKAEDFRDLLKENVNTLSDVLLKSEREQAESIKNSAFADEEAKESAAPEYASKYEKVAQYAGLCNKLLGTLGAAMKSDALTPEDAAFLEEFLSEHACKKIAADDALDDVIDEGLTSLTDMAEQLGIEATGEEIYDYDTKQSEESAEDFLKLRHIAEEAEKNKELNRQLKEQKKQEAEADVASMQRELELSRNAYKEDVSDDEITIRYGKAIEDAYVPKNVLGKIKSFTDYTGRKVEGVGKMKAFFSRNKLTGADIKERMSKHVRLFLSNKNGLSYKELVDTAKKIMDGSDVLKRYDKQKELKEEKGTFGLLKRLMDAKDGDVPALLAEARQTLGDRQDIKKELLFDSPYLQSHPAAAKIVAMQKLLDKCTVDASGIKDTEFKDRLDAATSNIGLLYQAVVGSEQYQNALHKQRIDYLTGEIEKQTSLIGELDSELKTMPKMTLGDKQEEIKEQEALHKQMAADMEKASETLKRQREEQEKKVKPEMSDKEMQAHMKALEESIAKKRREALAARQKKIEFAPDDKEKLQPLREGAIRRVETVVDAKVFDKIKKKGDFEAHRREVRDRVLEHAATQVRFFFGDKKLEELNAREVDGFANAMVTRLVQVPDLYERLFTSGEEYREYFLTNCLAGEESVEPAGYEAHMKERKEKVANADAILAACPAYKPSDRVTIRISELTKARGLGSHGMRSVNRIGRMRNLPSFVKKNLEAADLTMPMSIYEYKKSLADKAPEDQDELVDQYRKYIDAHFKEKRKTEIKPPAEFMGESCGKLSDLATLIKDNYSEFGVTERLPKLVNALGDTLTKKGNKEYQAELLKISMSAMEQKKEKKKEVDPSEAETVNARVEQFQTSLRGGKFAYLFPLLMETEEFKEHLLSDGNAEYESFLVEHVEAMENLTALFRKHSYVDQYLLERKDEIKEYLLSDHPEKINLEKKMDLDKLDDTINKKEISIRGSDAPKTFGALVDSMITTGAYKDDKEETNQQKAQFGSLFVEMILQGNATELLNGDEVNKVRERFGNNLDMLSKELDRVLTVDNKDLLLPDDMEDAQKKAVLEGFRASFMNNERQNMIYSSEENYREGLAERVQSDLKVLSEAYRANQQILIENARKKEFAKTVVEQKEKGRGTYLSFHAESESIFGEYCKEKEEDAEVKEEYKEDIEKYMNEARDSMTDPFLSGLYTTVLKRMIAHAAKDDKASFTADANTFLQLQGFSVAVDDYLASRPEEEKLPEYEKDSLKRGLFEVYGERILKGTEADKEKDPIETYKELITELLGEVGGFAVARYIVDDTGGFDSVRAGVAKGESNQAVKNREDFMKSFKTLLEKEDGTKDLIKKLTDTYKESELLLFVHILEKNTTMQVLNSLVGEILGKEESKFSVDNDAVFSAYISDQAMTNDLLKTNYNALLIQLAQEGDLKKKVEDACVLVDEWIEAKREKQALSQKQTELKEESKVDQLGKEMGVVIGATDAYIEDIASDKLMSARDKYWRMYVVMRAYDDTFTNYRKLTQNGTIKEDKKFQEMYVIYGSLQEYFGSENATDSLQKLMMYGLSERLGIMEKDKVMTRDMRKSAAGKRMAEEEKRQGVTDKVKTLLREKTGFRTDRTEQVVDLSEEKYPANVVAAVKKIDQWIAANALSWKGNSESNFGMEILGHPLRERLFVYYSIEKEKTTNPTGLDVSMALNAYIPNLEKFEKRMKSKISLLMKPVGALKQVGFVKKFGVLDTYGEVMTQNLEGAMRILDDKQLGVSGMIERISKQREQAGNANLPEEFRVREACYLEFVNAVEIQKALIKKKGKKVSATDPDLIRQSQKIARTYERFQLSNEAVQKLLGRRAPETVDEMEELKKQADTEIYKPEEDGIVSTLWSVATTLADNMSSVNEKVNEAGTDGLEITDSITIKPYELSKKQISNCFKAGFVFQSVDLLDNLLNLGSAIKDANDDTLTRNAKVSKAGDAIEAGGDMINSVLSTINFFDGISDTALETATQGVTGAVTMISSSMKTASNLMQRNEVKKSKEAALEFAREHETEEAQNNLNVSVTEAIANTSVMQEKLYGASATVHALKAAGGLASLIGAVAPGVGGVATAIGTVLSTAAKIVEFWKNKEIRESTVDDFLQMDTLYAELQGNFDQMEPETKAMYGDSEKDIRATIRKIALREMHFSTMEEFVQDITTQYAKVIFAQAFFDSSGKQILLSDTELINERKALQGLFPDFVFIYPEQEGQMPVPSAEDMARNLQRGVG